MRLHASRHYLAIEYKYFCVSVTHFVSCAQLICAMGPKVAMKAAPKKVTKATGKAAAKSCAKGTAAVRNQ